MKTNQTLLNIPLDHMSRSSILEKIVKSLKSPKGFFHIVSLNPEILVETLGNDEFRDIVTAAQIRINDGSGIVLAAKLKGLRHVYRYTGVELMEDLLKLGSKQRLRIMLLGGRPKIAERIVECQIQAGSKAIFSATEGIKDIHNILEAEENDISAIVADFRPHILLVAYGSPFSEIWLYRHRKLLKNVICASVGGSFDYISGNVRRPPSIVRSLGLEYMYRLIMQPWRWRRQMNLLTFVRLSLMEVIRHRLS